MLQHAEQRRVPAAGGFSASKLGEGESLFWSPPSPVGLLTSLTVITEKNSQKAFFSVGLGSFTLHYESN